MFSFFRKTAAEKNTPDPYPTAQDISPDVTQTNRKKLPKKKSVHIEIHNDQFLPEVESSALLNKLQLKYIAIFNLFLSSTDQITSHGVALERTITFVENIPQLLQNNKSKITKLNLDLEKEKQNLAALISKFNEIIGNLRAFLKTPRVIANKLNQYCLLPVDFSLAFNDLDILGNVFSEISLYLKEMNNKIEQFKLKIVELTDFINQAKASHDVDDIELNKKKSDLDKDFSLLEREINYQFSANSNFAKCLLDLRINEYTKLNVAFAFYQTQNNSRVVSESFKSSIQVPVSPTVDVRPGELSSAELIKKFKELDNDNSDNVPDPGITPVLPAPSTLPTQLSSNPKAHLTILKETLFAGAGYKAAVVMLAGFVLCCFPPLAGIGALMFLGGILVLSVTLYNHYLGEKSNKQLQSSVSTVQSQKANETPSSSTKEIAKVLPLSTPTPLAESSMQMTIKQNSVADLTVVTEPESNLTASQSLKQSK